MREEINPGKLGEAGIFALPLLFQKWLGDENGFGVLSFSGFFTNYTGLYTVFVPS